MKKFLPILMIAFVGLFVMSCDNRDDAIIEDNDTYSRVIDYNNVNLVKSSTSNSIYGFVGNLPSYFLASDALLIYQQIGTSNGNPIWKLLPNTEFVPQGEILYYFDYTVNDFQITANADFDLFIQNANFKNTYLNNQRFRVLLIPASFKNANIDYKDYNSVIKHFNIDDSKVTNL